MDSRCSRLLNVVGATNLRRGRTSPSLTLASRAFNVGFSISLHAPSASASRIHGWGVMDPWAQPWKVSRSMRFARCRDREGVVAPQPLSLEGA